MGRAAQAVCNEPRNCPAVALRGAVTALIVDDDAAFRRLLRQLLERAGCQVVAEASNGYEALAFSTALQPELITMDLEMPRLDGAAATALIAEDSSAAIVIVSSSHSRSKLDRALQAGAIAHIEKHKVTIELPNVVELVAARRRRGAA
jgi:two-component system, response regulator PdtaR